MATALNVQGWSITAASNDGADSTIGAVADTSAPDAVDNWTRGVMASVKRHSLDTGGGVAAVGGSANAITITTNQVISSGHETAGFSLRFKAANTNTGATTVAVDGLSAQAVERMDGTALSAGDIVAGGIYDIAYNATNGGYTLMTGINPSNLILLSAANAFTNTNTFTKTSAGAAATQIVLVNSSTTAGTEAVLDLVPTDAGAGVRGAQVVGHQYGSNDISLIFKTSANSGAAPSGRGMVRLGAVFGSTATADDKGSGTVNATAGLYDNGTRIGGAVVASFHAAKVGSNQNIATTDATEITWTEDFDVGGLFASNGWTPPAGTVRVSATLGYSSVADGSTRTVYILKNGAALALFQGDDSELQVAVSVIDQADGNDVYTIASGSTDASYTVLGTVGVSWFEGSMI